MGLTFIYAGIQHLTDPSYFNPSKHGFIGNLVAQYAVGSPIRDFLIGVVQPNAVAFGYIVAVGEILIGTAVSVGLLFRIAALAGLLLNFTFFLSATWNAFPFYFGSDIVFVMCWLTLLLTGPQIGLSLDGMLAEKFGSLRWLVSSRQISQVDVQSAASRPEPAKTESVPIPAGAKLYPKKISEKNRANERIKEKFVSHEETQTILEF
jgi:thiosulfate dehydrogenase [quinone] large subunit